MSKLDKMNMFQIVEQTNLYLTDSNLDKIWKRGTHLAIIERGIKALRELKAEDGTTGFMQEFGIYIDKVQFLILLIDSYEQRLKESIDEVERRTIEKSLPNVRKLLSDTDENYIFYYRDNETAMITDVKIFNTRELAKGKSSKDKNNNAQRLEKLKKEMDFSHVAQAVLRFDIENVIMENNQIGVALKYKIEFNTLAENLDSNELRRQLRDADIRELADKQRHSIYVPEIIKTLEEHIEDVDFDKLLLSSARNYINWAEMGAIGPEEIEFLRGKLEIIKNNITRKNAKVPAYEGGDYTPKELERDLKRFIVREDKTYFMTKEKCLEIKKKLLEGKILISELTLDDLEVSEDITISIVEALNLKPADISAILRANPENYIYFFKHGEVTDFKEIILRDIIKANQCSQELLQLLCEKTNITAEDICDLFDKGIISIEHLKLVREQVGTIITDNKLFEKYEQYRSCKEKSKDGEEAKAARAQLETYALAYRTTELADKSNEEIEDKGFNFVDEQFGNSIKDSDLISLYRFGIIPFKVAVGLGGPTIATELLKNESLKRTDIMCLREEGILTKDFIKDLFRNACPNMSYVYQLVILDVAFDSNTPEGQEEMKELLSFLHIEAGTSKTSKEGKTERRMENVKPQNTRVDMQRETGRDPWAKLNLLNAVDKDVRIEEGIIDGHVVFHYPNVKNGVVLIEKLHTTKVDRATGTIQVNADNETATYVMSEEEFIQMREELIKDGKIDRTQLTKKWARPHDPYHRKLHAGVAAWEEALIEYLEINENNPRLSKEELEAIRKLMIVSVSSKEQYTPEQMKKIERLISKKMRAKQEDAR